MEEGELMAEIKVIEKVYRLKDAEYRVFTEAAKSVEQKDAFISILRRTFHYNCLTGASQKGYFDLIGVRHEEFHNLQPKEGDPYFEIRVSYHYRVDNS
jgi:hypothetical protein